MANVKTNIRPRTYQKRLSLYPLKFEDAVARLLKVKPVKKKKKTNSAA